MVDVGKRIEYKRCWGPHKACDEGLCEENAVKKDTVSGKRMIDMRA